MTIIGRRIKAPGSGKSIWCSTEAGHPSGEYRDMTEDMARIIRDKYTRLTQSKYEKLIRHLPDLYSLGLRPKTAVGEFLMEIADTIRRYIRFQQVVVSLLDPKDRLYKFVVVQGHTPETTREYKSLTYTADDLFDRSNYPSVQLSNRTFFYMGEHHPYIPGEEKFFYRPSKMGQKRDSPDKMLWDDYICCYFYDLLKKPLGWIEVANKIDNKLPEKEDIVFLEFFASMVEVFVNRPGK